ncbi:hypothetical protein GJ496_010134 [Pomphorhynchus laevis]|nr:hypothetical protein GJ496_010134 [Pomphorhynchus laevis]
MSLEQDQMSAQNFNSNFNDSDTDDNDDFFVHVETELQNLSIQHLRVLAASDEDDTEDNSIVHHNLMNVRKPTASSNLSNNTQQHEMSYVRANKRRSGRRKPFRNPILLSAQYRQKHLEQNGSNSNTTEGGLANKGLTYIDCLLFDEERRKRRSNRDKRKPNVLEKSSAPIMVGPHSRDVVANSIDIVSRENETNEQRNSQAMKKDLIVFQKSSDKRVNLSDDKFEADDDERVTPDSALGSEAGSSTDHRVECLCQQFTARETCDLHNRLTPHPPQEQPDNQATINTVKGCNLTSWRKVKKEYTILDGKYGITNVSISSDSNNTLPDGGGGVRSSTVLESSLVKHINFSQLNRFTQSSLHDKMSPIYYQKDHMTASDSLLLELINFRQITDARSQSWCRSSVDQHMPVVVYCCDDPCCKRCLNDLAPKCNDTQTGIAKPRHNHSSSLESDDCVTDFEEQEIEL